jgi:hypothetical protein
VRRSCGRNRSAQVGPEPDREGSQVGNRSSLPCQTARGSVCSFVLTGLRRSLSTTPVGEVADFDELPTRDNADVSSVSRLKIGFKSERPKARCAGFMLRRETAQMFSPSSRTRNGQPLMPMNGIGIRSAACAGTPFPTAEAAQPDRLGGFPMVGDRMGSRFLTMCETNVRLRHPQGTATRW